MINIFESFENLKFNWKKSGIYKTGVLGTFLLKL